MPRATKTEAIETRNRIIEAAERTFHAQGVSRTSLEDVARAAEVTRGAIYWHFKNKGDLFDAMSQRVKLPMEEMVQAGCESGQIDPLGQIRSTLIFVLQETVLNPRSRMVFDIIFLKCEFVDANDPIWIRQQEGCSKALANFAKIMQNAIVRQQLPADLDVPLACRAMQSFLIGLINSWLFMPATLDLANEAPRLVDGCLDMLRYAPSLRCVSASTAPTASAAPH